MVWILKQQGEWYYWLPGYARGGRTVTMVWISKIELHWWFWTFKYRQTLYWWAEYSNMRPVGKLYWWCEYSDSRQSWPMVQYSNHSRPSCSDGVNTQGAGRVVLMVWILKEQAELHWAYEYSKNRQSGTDRLYCLPSRIEHCSQEKCSHTQTVRVADHTFGSYAQIQPYSMLSSTHQVHSQKLKCALSQCTQLTFNAESKTRLLLQAKAVMYPTLVQASMAGKDTDHP